MKKALAALGLAVAIILPSTPAHAYHDRGGDDGYCYEEEQCEGYGYGDGGDRSRQDYDQWNNEDHNRNRNRNRGAFSPGPFDRSPLDFRNACISLDCSGRNKDDEQRQDERRDRRNEPQIILARTSNTQSLFPPSPGAVKDFVVNTIKAGIELGKLFAETTISFVENIMVGIA